MKDESREASSGFWKIGSMIRLALFILLVCAVASHSKEDLYLLDGGMDEPVVFRNWIGLAGAHVARALFFLFGLAVYPLLAVIGLCLIRTFLPGRAKSGGRFGAVLAMTIGFSILFAMHPEKFIVETDALGLGRMESTDLVLSGGVVGSKLAAPSVSDILEAGLIKRFIGDVGTMIVAGFLILPSAVFLFIRDWQPLIADAFAKWRSGDASDNSERETLKELQRRKREEEEKAKEEERRRREEEEKAKEEEYGRREEDDEVEPPPVAPPARSVEPDSSKKIPPGAAPIRDEDEETRERPVDDDDGEYRVTPPRLIPSGTA